MEIRRFRDAQSISWPNGTGLTREIFRQPPDQADFEWRLSVADVSQSGPFSTLVGIDRTIVFCQGPRMTLSVDGRSADLELRKPFHFSGDSTTTCQVPEGPTRDVNVMTNRRTTVVKTRIVTVDQNQAVNFGSPDSALIALTPGLTLAKSSCQGSPEMSVFDTVLPYGKERVSLSGFGTVLLAEFQTRSMSTSDRALQARPTHRH